MAVISLLRSSKILNMQTNVSVILPDEIKFQQKIPTIWLFHGLGDNGTGWKRKTNLEQIASKYEVAVVMPNMGRSFYTNSIYGNNYWDYLVKELIPQMREYFPLSCKPEFNYLIGNSMGGYGALKLAFKYPDWFSKVAFLSPVTDLSVVPSIMPDYQSVFGKDGISDRKNDLRYMSQNADASSLERIQWYQATGNKDFMRKQSDSFNEFLTTKIHLNITYSIEEGKHNWDYWNSEIEKVFLWLSLKRK